MKNGENIVRNNYDLEKPQGFETVTLRISFNILSHTSKDFIHRSGTAVIS